MRCTLTLLGLTGLFLSACASPLARVAAIHLDCPPSRVDVEEGENTAHASGCGRQITYRRECRAMTATDMWGRTDATVCRWEPGGSGYRDDHYEPGWDSKYRGTRAPASQPSWQRQPDAGASSSVVPATPAPSPGEPSSEAVATSETKSPVVIADLGDLKDAEATLRKWVGKPVRLALSNGQASEGVLQYVRTFTLWFADGSQHRIEDILAAELIELAP